MKYLLPLFILLVSCAEEDSTNEEEPTDPRKKTYLKYCMSCHGASGTMGFSGSADLTQSIMPRDSVVYMIKKGKNAMLPMEDVMTAEDIEIVADYVMSIRTNKQE